MNKLGVYQNILRNMEDTYKAKNNDYGDSVGYTYKKYGDISFLVRITDKFNRIESLTAPKHNITVKDEQLEDTILDLANYCLLWLVEKEAKKVQDEISPKLNESYIGTGECVKSNPTTRERRCVTKPAPSICELEQIDTGKVTANISVHAGHSTEARPVAKKVVTVEDVDNTF